MSKEKTANRLKTMIKNSNHHFLRNLGRIFKYGGIGFMRNIWLSITATIVTTLTLVLLFATVVAGSILTSTADSMREKIDISVFFEPGTAKRDLVSMANTMKRDSNVKSVEVSTSEEVVDMEIQEAKEKGDEQMLRAFEIADKEHLIKGMPAIMRIKVYNSDDLSSIKSTVATDKEFQENISKTKTPTYDANSSTISTISSWADIATKGGAALSILFLIISILVIFNTIRMAIYSRSEEIYMEKLVGADNSFIRGPFHIEAMISGILAGILSGLTGILGFNALSPNLERYEINVGYMDSYLSVPQNIILVFLALVGIGIVITFISSRLAIHKYLKRF